MKPHNHAKPTDNESFSKETMDLLRMLAKEIARRLLIKQNSETTPRHNDNAFADTERQH